MLTSIHKRLTGAVLALSCLSFTGAAAAETVELNYLMPKIGVEFLYGGMGYDDADGNFIELSGSHIVSSSVIVNFRPARGVDISTFFLAMSVPVSGVASTYFVVDSSMLVKTGRNRYTYSLTTDMFNGEIIPGRFSVESYGLDALGNPISLRGLLSADTGFHYTVDTTTAAVPEPASAALLLGGLLLMPLLARRQRRINAA